MKTENREFEVQVPKIDGSGVAEKVKVMVPVYWDEEIKDWLMTPEAHEIIDATKARLIGLLLPAQLKELRERYDYTQNEMGELFQVGEKSWTRWESGKQRPSRSINLLVRALYDGEISINYLLERAGKPQRETEVAGRQSPWLALGTATGMRYMVFTHSSFVRFQKGSGKSEFLEAFLEHAQPGTPIWPPQVVANKARLMPLGNKTKRFDYPNAELA